MIWSQTDQARHSGRLQEAEELCRRVLALDPHTAAAYQCLSLIAHQVGKPALAAELMAKAVDCAPRVASYRRNLCEMYRRLKRLDEAIVHGREAIRLADNDAEAFYNLGVALDDKIIHSMRDPMDSCLSNYTRLFNETMEFAYSLEELERYYNRYIQVMQHWDRVLPEGVLLHMPYEAIVRDLPLHARRIIAHVGLEWDPACLKFYENRRPVRTASVAQVRQPNYNSSVARWQAYGDGLRALRDIVGDNYPHGLPAPPV